MHPFIETQKEWTRAVPPFRSGDTLRVNVRVREGDKERVQVFSGTVIMRKGDGINANFTVRRIGASVPFLTEEERKRLEESAKGKDEEFRKRYSELEAKYKDMDPKSPGFEAGRAEVEGFFKEVEGWRKEFGEKLSKLQAEQIEKAYREMTTAVDVVAVDVVDQVIALIQITRQRVQLMKVMTRAMQHQMTHLMRMQMELLITAVAVAAAHVEQAQKVALLKRLLMKMA